MDKKKQEEYHFVKEHIKKIPIDRKKLRTRLFGTILLAVLFGVVAAAVFAALRPVFDNLLYRKDNTVVISGEDEISEETPEESALRKRSSWNRRITRCCRINYMPLAGKRINP